MAGPLAPLATGWDLSPPHVGPPLYVACEHREWSSFLVYPAEECVEKVWRGGRRTPVFRIRIRLIRIRIQSKISIRIRIPDPGSWIRILDPDPGLVKFIEKIIFSFL